MAGESAFTAPVEVVAVVVVADPVELFVAAALAVEGPPFKKTKSVAMSEANMILISFRIYMWEVTAGQLKIQVKYFYGWPRPFTIPEAIEALPAIAHPNLHLIMLSRSVVFFGICVPSL